MQHADRIKISLLYFFMIAGGLWHLLGVFERTMSVLAGPVLIVLGLWLLFEQLLLIRKEGARSGSFLIWSAAVILVSFSAELAGVKTGRIFGSYSYGPALWPQMFGVPLAIGFAWLVMLLSSLALVQRMPLIRDGSPLLRSALVALLMTFFDFLMEPAAIKLGYWSWSGGQIPLQNYLAWFALGWLLSAGAAAVGLYKTRPAPLAFHAYFAQLIYFIMVGMV